MVLPPGGTGTLDGRVPPRSPESFNGKIFVTSGPFEFSVPFRVFPPPAHIDFEPGPTLDFGVVRSGQVATRELVVRNTGGADALLRADVTEGLRLVPEADGIILSPGGEKRFEVSMDTGKAGRLDSFSGIAVSWRCVEGDSRCLCGRWQQGCVEIFEDTAGCAGGCCRGRW
jgi:hypothetical protein